MSWTLTLLLCRSSQLLSLHGPVMLRKVDDALKSCITLLLEMGVRGRTVYRAELFSCK